MGDEALFDLEVLLQQVGGDEAFMKSMVESYIDKTPEQIQDLAEACQQGDWQQVGALAHKLKSPARMMGMKTITEMLLDIERSGKQVENTQEIPAKVQEVEMLIYAAIKEMKKSI